MNKKLCDFVDQSEMRLYLLEQETGIYSNNIPLDDKNVFKLYHKCDTLGIWECDYFEYEMMCIAQKRLRPESIEALVDIAERCIFVKAEKSKKEIAYTAYYLAYFKVYYPDIFYTIYLNTEIKIFSFSKILLWADGIRGLKLYAQNRSPLYYTNGEPWFDKEEIEIRAELYNKGYSFEPTTISPTGFYHYSLSNKCFKIEPNGDRIYIPVIQQWMLRQDGVAFEQSDCKCTRICDAIQTSEWLYYATLRDETKNIIMEFLSTWLENIFGTQKFSYNVIVDYCDLCKEEYYPKNFIQVNYNTILSTPPSDKSLFQFVNEINILKRQEFCYVCRGTEEDYYLNEYSPNITFTILQSEFNWNKTIECFLENIDNTEYLEEIIIQYWDN